MMEKTPEGIKANAQIALTRLREAVAELEITLVTGVCSHPYMYEVTIYRVPSCRVCGQVYPQRKD